MGGVGQGIKTSAKAATNTVVNTVTIGYVDEAIAVTDFDLGYEEARFGFELANLANPLDKAGKVGKVVNAGLNVAQDAKAIGEGVAGVYHDGLNSENVQQIAGGVFGRVTPGNSGSKPKTNTHGVAEGVPNPKQPKVDAPTNETGSYTNTHASGKTYDGKGSRQRSQDSARRVEKETGDPHIATDWKPSATQRDAFKDEAKRLESHGGPGFNNHNKIESPGKKYRKLDGDTP